jgi:hypothetical protein
MRAGTAWRRVAAGSAAISRSRSRAGTSGTSSTVPPEINGLITSKRKMSKENGASAGMRSPRFQPNSRRLARSVLARLPCSAITPLGLPVVPEV